MFATREMREKKNNAEDGGEEGGEAVKKHIHFGKKKLQRLEKQREEEAEMDERVLRSLESGGWGGGGAENHSAPQRSQSMDLLMAGAIRGSEEALKGKASQKLRVKMMMNDVCLRNQTPQKNDFKKGWRHLPSCQPSQKITVAEMEKREGDTGYSPLQSLPAV